MVPDVNLVNKLPNQFLIKNAKIKNTPEKISHMTINEENKEPKLKCCINFSGGNGSFSAPWIINATPRKNLRKKYEYVLNVKKKVCTFIENIIQIKTN